MYLDAQITFEKDNPKVLDRETEDWGRKEELLYTTLDSFVTSNLVLLCTYYSVNKQITGRDRQLIWLYHHDNGYTRIRYYRSVSMINSLLSIHVRHPNVSGVVFCCCCCYSKVG